MPTSYEYTCGTCNKRFPSGMRARDRHCAAHGHVVPAFECYGCPRFFKTESARKQHEWVKNHCAYLCELCEGTWPTLAELQQHSGEEHDWWLCGECDEGFHSEGELQAHVDDDHEHYCAECDHHWDTRWELRDHEEEEHWHECGWCPDRLPTEAARRAHDREVHEYYECEVCEEEFAEQWELDDHEAYWHSGEKCDECGEEELTRAQLKLHLAGHRYECEWCPWVFSSRKELQQHALDSRAAHYCHKCEELFYSASDLKQHEEDHDREPLCRFCDFPGWNKPLLHDHERQDHFYCHECNRRFGDRNQIEQHLRSWPHVGQPIGCPFCDRGFTTAAGLVHHLERNACRAAPQVDIRYLCQVITDREPMGYLTSLLWPIHTLPFRKRWTTVKHTRWGNRWRCWMCTIMHVSPEEREFPTYQALVSHIHSDHPMDTFPCPNRKCGKEFTTLAGTVNHLESEACGYAKFKQVQGAAGDIVGTHRVFLQ